MDRVEHIIACVGEECGEVQQKVGKALRFGIFEANPKTSNSHWSEMRQEVHDIVAVYEMLCEEFNVETELDRNLIDSKKEKVEHYMIDDKQHYKPYQQGVLPWNTQYQEQQQ